jgi:hypothetical protein
MSFTAKGAKAGRSGVFGAIHGLLARLCDLTEWYELRQAAIEDRLAALDGKANAQAARREARSTLMQNRVSAGQSADLNFKIDE